MTVINFERDAIWPDFPPRIAQWSAGAASNFPPIWQDGVVSTHVGYVRSPNGGPGTSGNGFAYGLAMIPPKDERTMYRVRIECGRKSGEKMYGSFTFADVSGGAGDVTPTLSTSVMLGHGPLDLAVCIPPHPSDPDLALVFAVNTRDDVAASGYIAVQRLVGRPPQFALSIS